MEIKCEQRSDEWFAVKVGKLSSSIFPDLMKTPKQRLEWNQTQMAILRKVAAELFTGGVEDSFSSRAIEWGVEHEDYARELWAIENFETVRTCGFYQHSEYIGSSPDFIIIRDGVDWGVGEIKCPTSKNHVLYLLDPGELLKAYYGQVLGQSLVTGLHNYVLTSFDPRFPDGKQFVTMSGTFNNDELKGLEERMNDAVDLILSWIS